MPKVFFIIVLILMLGSASFPQQKANQPKEYVMPAELQTLLLEAGTLPPELAVDVSLKIISSGKIENKPKKKQLLEEAFYLSNNAKEKTRREVIAFSGRVLTIRPTFISYAQQNKLDALSLKTRIVSEMLKIDRVRAFELFNEILPELSLKPLSCQDFLLYEISDFYDLVGEMAKNSFTQKQIKQGRRITFLSSYIESMTSAAQLAPVVKMLSLVDLTEDEKLNLVSRFSKSIRRISGDDRTFSYQMNFGSMYRDIYKLSEKLISSPEIYDEFLKSYRDYLLKNLRGTRCWDNVEFEKPRGKPKENNANEASNTKLPFYIIDANKYFYKDSPIALDDAEPDKIEKVTFPNEYYTAPKAREIYNKVRKVRDWKEKDKTISEIKESLEWQEAVTNLLEEIDEWEKADDEDEIDLFHQKSLLYRILLRETPSFALREKIVRKYLKLLNQSRIQIDFVTEWFLEFNDLRKEISAIEPKEEQPKLVDVLKNSNNSTVRIYPDLEGILKSEKTKPEAKTTPN